MWMEYDGHCPVGRCVWDEVKRAYWPLKKDSVDPRTDSRLEFGGLRKLGCVC